MQTDRKKSKPLYQLSTQEDYVSAYAITRAELEALVALVSGPFMAEYPSLIPAFLRDVRRIH